MLIIFFHINFKKKLTWQAKQSVPHITVTLYSNCVKMCEDFTPTFALASQQHSISASGTSFSPVNFLPQTT
jgi:hypothetical protein